MACLKVVPRGLPWGRVMTVSVSGGPVSVRAVGEFVNGISAGPPRGTTCGGRKVIGGTAVILTVSSSSASDTRPGNAKVIASADAEA